MTVEDVLQIGNHIEMKAFDDKSFLLINNNTQKYLRISENYKKLIEQIDGKQNIKNIVSAFNKNSPKPITEQNAILIIKKLDQIGLFSESKFAHSRKKLPDYITIGFIFFPKKWVGKIVPYLKFLFNKKIAFFSVIFCCIFLVYLFYKNFSTNHAYNFLQILPFYFLVSFIATMFHELGHATAAHFYKAKHGGIGFGIYFYFMPVFFADVTDIWRLNKWKRIVVNTSGVYFEILFCGILAIIGLLLDNKSLFAIVSILSIRTLYNLLPYFRNDGYWILSDYLNQPNLLVTSFKKSKDMAQLKIKNFLAKDYFLAFYGILNISLMIYFMGVMIFLYNNHIISFPQKIISFFSNISNESFNWSFSEVFNSFPIILFYFIVIKVIISFIKKKIKINM